MDVESFRDVMSVHEWPVFPKIDRSIAHPGDRAGALLNGFRQASLSFP